MTAAVDVVVCVPTYRRPAMLEATLRSLAAQRTTHGFAVVVVDNDAAGREGLQTAQRLLAETGLPGTAAVQPAQGNCHAINAALALARARFPDARFLAMIDDDEVAAPAWLAELVAAAEESGADVVGGPVHPRFEATPAAAVARHPVFHPAFQHSGPVPMIYGSGNFLVRTAALARLAEPSFDVSFNTLGGGDTDFFTRCRQAGMVFVWNEAARITETVPASRQRTGWILRRGLRIGAINFRIDRRQARGPAGLLRVHAKNLALLPVSLWRALRALAASGSPLIAVHPLTVAAGRVLASFGVEAHQYKAASQP